MQLCDAPELIPTRKVRDIQGNRDLNLAAYSACSARMCRLVQWIQRAARVDAVSCEAK